MRRRGHLCFLVFLDLGETLYCFAPLLFQGQGEAIARANQAMAFQMRSNAVEYLCVGDAQFWQYVFWFVSVCRRRPAHFTNSCFVLVLWSRRGIIAGAGQSLRFDQWHVRRPMCPVANLPNSSAAATRPEGDILARAIADTLILDTSKVIRFMHSCHKCTGACSIIECFLQEPGAGLSALIIASWSRTLKSLFYLIPAGSV